MLIGTQDDLIRISLEILRRSVMTPLQKRCQELLPVIQAGAEGKTIQWRQSVGEDWKKKVDGVFSEYTSYRIKPEPQYRPFTPEEALAHTRDIVESKETGRLFSIQWVNADRVRFSDDSTSDFKMLLARFRFHDGTPCGVLVEDGQ